MRTELGVLLVAALAACSTHQSPNGTSPIDGESTAQRGTMPESASLLRRLAEAADGYRDGEDRFVVAALEFPHQVLGVFPTRAQADSVATRSTTEEIHYRGFGPYRTLPEANVSSEVTDVDSVVAYYPNGRRQKFDGDKYDALFWGMPAFDKFVAPYLTSVSGVAHAARQRQAYKRGALTNSVLPHKRYSF